MTCTTYRIDGRLHLAYSLLGRLLRLLVKDPRRAESLYIVFAAFLVTGWGLLQFFLWITAPTLFLSLPALTLAGWGLLLVSCGIGFQPAVQVRLADNKLFINRAAHTLNLCLSRITNVEQVSDLVFHQHYRRYRRTQTFVNRIPKTVLLLHTPDGPVALGLTADDQQDLLNRLAPHLTLDTPSFTA